VGFWSIRFTVLMCHFLDRRDALPLQRTQDGVEAVMAAREHLEHGADNRRLFLVDEQVGRAFRCLPHVPVPEGGVPLADELSGPHMVQCAPPRPLDDLRPLELRDRAEDLQGEPVFGIFLVVLAVDDDPLFVSQALADDDGLMDHIAGDAIRAQKIHHVERIGFHVEPQLVERGAVEICAAVSVVDVLFDERVTGGDDLPLQLGDLALNRLFLLLPVGTGVARR